MCLRHLQGALIGMRPFSIFGLKKFFCNISISGRGTGASDMSTAPTRCPDRYATIFNFGPKNFFFNISISGRGTRASNVSTAPTRCTYRYTTIFNFRTKKVFLQYLDFRTWHGSVGCVYGTYKVPCSVYDHFQFTDQKFFLQYLDFWTWHGSIGCVYGTYKVP